MARLPSRLMDALVAWCIAKTPAWTVAVLEASRQGDHDDAAWKDGNYEAPPEKGVWLWRDILSLFVGAHAGHVLGAVQDGMDVLPWMEAAGDRGAEGVRRQRLDSYQTWAYERHDVGTTPGFEGDTAKALARSRRNADPHRHKGPAQPNSSRTGREETSPTSR